MNVIPTHPFPVCVYCDQCSIQLVTARLLCAVFLMNFVYLKNFLFKSQLLNDVTFTTGVRMSVRRDWC